MILSDEQAGLQSAVQDFCRRECGTLDRVREVLDPGEDSQSSALYSKIAGLGWLGIAIPEQYGGSGGTYVDQTVLFEALNRGGAPVKAIGATTTVAGCYKRFGSESQKAQALSSIAGGEIMAISISEPGAGSDVAAVSCQAKKVDGGYLINGQKTWCSYAHLAGRILLLARTSREDKAHRGLTVFEVPTNAHGIVTRRIPTMGGDEVNDVFYTDVFVPDTAVVGEVGRGFVQIMAGLDGERLLAAAVSLGIAQRALEQLVSYLNDRKQFGKALSDFQVLRHRVADLAIELECARLLTYEAAQALESNDTGRRVTELASMAKTKASETAKQVCLEGVQMMGGYGYAVEYGMEANLRHSILLPIYAGANEIQREIISGSIGLA
ncbi:acyl-CoA dehydrogenase family protein [Gordonia rubripertincta]|uniref:acyl-CoA dehydrogenase family protein n=1 Tax=Gordonia rubripertincta TaxID=36822 RepID=UPI0027DFA390|nr:acyl-CoA dehydrogenase family protein [Gordonia rubripertincta]